MNSLLHGDCLELLPALEDASVDMVLSDLPYGTTNCRWDCPIDLARLWPELERVCRGAIVLFAQTPFDKVLGCSNLEHLKYEWIWEKSHPTGHLNARLAPMKAHENILVFYEHPPTYNPQKTSGHERKAAYKRQCNSPVYGKQEFDGLVYDSTDRYPRSVIGFPSDKQQSSLHPTQKPLALVSYLIATYTNAGDTILDFCAGSGTTGVACSQMSRSFVGMELDKDFAGIAERRIAQACPLFG